MRKTLPALLTAAALLGIPNISDCQSASASHGIRIIIQPLRALYVNESDEITAIGMISDGIVFPEDKIVVFKNGSQIALNDKIREQYYAYLEDPRIDWDKRPGYHYYYIFQQPLAVEETTKPTFSDETPDSIITETEENGILYRTMTGK